MYNLLVTKVAKFETFMRMTVANNIKSTFKKTESAKEFMKFVEE